MFSKGMALAGAALSMVALSHWTAVLEPKAGSQVRGTATIESVNPDSIRATVQVNGAAPGAVYAWHVHRGTCGAMGQVYGKPEMYPTITAGQDGAASTTIVLAVSPPSVGDYSVNVHKSATDMTPVACGDLKPAEAATPPKPNADAMPVPYAPEPPKPSPTPQP